MRKVQLNSPMTKGCWGSMMFGDGLMEVDDGC